MLQENVSVRLRQKHSENFVIPAGAESLEIILTDHKGSKMELSKRLTAVASLVTAGMKILDIGTDHGYIPIYLVKNGIIPGAVAMDVNKGPLERAEKNIQMYGLEQRIEVRISDGFSAAISGEAQAAVIAGMGGGLMIRILNEGKKIVDGLNECILQPQSEVEKVRAFLLEEGFLFVREDMVEEDGKYYPMMKVIPPGRQTAPQEKRVWSEEQLCYGRILLEEKHAVLEEYLQRELKLKKDIQVKLGKQQTENTARRCAELSREIELIRKGLSYYAL